jgi:hypothetical protein
MAKVELNVVDPQRYGTGMKEQPALMTYAESGSPVVIDTDTAFIECEAQGKSDAINKWMADYDNHKMKLADDPTDGNYKEIDFVAAMSLAGQLTMEIGIRTLQTLIETLDRVYDGLAPKDPSGNDEDMTPPEEA